MNRFEFATQFVALTGRAPFPWQVRMFARMVGIEEGGIPESCSLPTGTGKTSFVHIWMLALAATPNRVPRRLVYVVNRRTVVDQTTAEVVAMRQALDKPELAAVRARLVALSCVQGPPVALSTLRGQFADNGEWLTDPCRPSVIVGTVDMIGSRLLFSGYRAGFKSRPHHAGLIGQDALFVHDEAHLEPAFQALLEAVRREQRDGGRRIHVVELTATSRSGRESYGLTDSEWEDGLVGKRVGAEKKLSLHACDGRSVEPIVAKALARPESGRAVIIFLRQVDEVLAVAEQLRKDKLLSKSVETLTGTMRGLERDQLVERPVFKRFLQQPDAQEGTVFLVCTSAGEVGVNLSADDLICDLTPFDSMAQRFGRVNRFGEVPDARVDVFHPAKFDKAKKGAEAFQAALQRTLPILKRLEGQNVNPRILQTIPEAERVAAFSPAPHILPLTDILLDSWSLTSIRGKLPGRPPVEAYLHGVENNGEPPRTSIAWRQEVSEVHGPLITQYPPELLLEAFPLKPHELLSELSERVKKALKKVQARLGKDGRLAGDVPVWLLSDEGSVQVLTLHEVVDKPELIEGATLLLPPDVGGLDNGMLNGAEAAPAQGSLDVSEQWKSPDGELLRMRSWGPPPSPERWRCVLRIDKRNPDSGDDEEDGEQRVWFWFAATRAADAGEAHQSAHPVPLEEHLLAVEAFALAFAKKLGLDEQMTKVLQLAGRWHDLGKRRVPWQVGIGNPQPTQWLAKSGPRMRGVLVGEYRHEFGSLIDLAEQPEFADLTQDQQDLLLHLVAAHHGRARPHFTAAEAVDPERSLSFSREVRAAVPHRFARLQQRYGHWRLAYLESILRAADYAASAGLNLKPEEAQ